MRTAIAVIIGDEAYTPQGVRINEVATSNARPVAVNDSREVDAPMHGVDEIAAMLARAVRLTQALNATDRWRARELFAAAQSLLHATTRLEKPDQSRFENALRNA